MTLTLCAPDRIPRTSALSDLGRLRRPASPANVATTDFRPSLLPIHPPLAYNSFSYPEYPSPKYTQTVFRPRNLLSLTTAFDGQHRPCPGVGAREGTHGKGLMSDRPEQKPSGSTTRHGSNAASPTISPPPSHNSQRTISGLRSVTSPVTQGRSAGRFELPPLNQSSSVTFPPPPGRIAGVSSILNPSQPDDSIQNRRRKASQLDSPAPSVQSLPSIATSTQSTQPTSAFTGHSPSLHHGAIQERPPRRILTPRSPSLHRAASLGQLHQSAATINAQHNPFPSSPHSRAYTIEPGTSGAPPLPTPPGIHRPGYGFPPNTSEGPRRTSGSASRARGLSSSASPTTSYSSYSQMEQTSPAAQYVTTSQSTSGDALIALHHSANASLNAFGSERQRPMGIPISSSGGQNVYQMMTLETTSGTVQLPVDVQAASRVADEKRRRNAGASARFRQRRKEKEKEASTTIARLEQQVKELGEDADFYRRERDIFQGILSTIPGCERHLQRPPSPRLRRSSSQSIGGHNTAALGGPAPEQVPRSPESRNVRRRTSAFSLPPPPPPPLPPHHQIPVSGASYRPNYGPSLYGAPLAPQPHSTSQSGHHENSNSNIGRGQLQQAQQTTHGHPQSLPPPSMAQQTQPQGPPQVLQPIPQTGPWNPYPSENRQSAPQSRPQDGR